MKRGYGWRPDKPDFRDARYSVHPRLGQQLKPVVDFRAKMPPVYDQGDLGSCTANAIAACFQYDQEHVVGACPECGQDRTGPSSSFTPSRLFIYYNERVIEHSVGEDAGAEIRDGIKSVVKTGVCPEGRADLVGNWDYDVARFAEKPPPDCYSEAIKHEAIVYARVNQDLCSVKSVLATGLPITIGFTVYESFESDQVAADGIVPMPGSNEEVLGGHAVVLVGYDEPSRRFICRNSWGTEWGQQGYFTMPYEYVLSADLADDFWVLQSVS